MGQIVMMMIITAFCVFTSVMALPDIKLSAQDFEKQLNKKLYDTEVTNVDSDTRLRKMEKKINDTGEKQKLIENKTKDHDDKFVQLEKDIVTMEEKKDKSWQNINEVQANGDHNVTEGERRYKDTKMEIESLHEETKELAEKYSTLQGKLQKAQASAAKHANSKGSSTSSTYSAADTPSTIPSSASSSSSGSASYSSSGSTSDAGSGANTKSSP